MANQSEREFLDYLKQAEATETDDDKRTAVGTTNVYPEPADAPHRIEDPVHFSDVAQNSSKDVRQGVVGRTLSGNSDAADRALIGAVLTTRDFETSSLHLKPVEKVSHVRTQTLLEKVKSILGQP